MHRRGEHCQVSPSGFLGSVRALTYKEPPEMSHALGFDVPGWGGYESHGVERT